MKTKSIALQSLILAGLLLFLSSCNEKYPPTDLNNNNIIPKPLLIKATHKTFVLNNKSAIYLNQENEELVKTGEYLAQILRPSTGFPLEIISTTPTQHKGAIYLILKSIETFQSKEAYKINIDADKVEISASDVEGIFRGIQTLRQLLPAEIENSEIQKKDWLLPTGIITDKPEYSYRSAMLDVSRHFFGVPIVKQYIDQLALYKINILHLHLTDDQGWRIEIKSWPNLTLHGASTQVGGGEGGFYTQEDYKEIVQYAAERFITVVPEIDMPGHTNAALASYPELNCNNEAPELYTGTEVGFSTFCIEKEVVYQLVEDVVREISEITPGPWFHMGGDESHSTKQKDFIYFINRTRDIIESNGKQAIGWSEIALADVNEQTTVQFWNKAENAKIAISKGCKLIISPAEHTYMDMKYDSTTVLGLDWAGYTEVDLAYNWEPTAQADGISKENILGIEAPLWSETIENLDDINFLAFPRLPGHAEIGWTPHSLRNWEEYKVRLASHAERFNQLGINYYRSELVPWTTE